MKLLTSAEAASLLGVAPSTLYAYVSRGLLESVRGQGVTRRLYRAEEVLQLVRQRRYGHAPKKAVGEALHLGLPVLESSLSLIESGDLFYRGRSVAELARTHSLEDTARLLWGCDEADDPFQAGVAGLGLARPSRPCFKSHVESVVARCIDILTANPIDESESTGRACASVVRLVTAAVLQRKPSAQRIDRQCARAWGLDAKERECVRASLVVCADHELNVSSFTARCAASCGATLSASVIAGLAALSGSLHGGYSDRVEAMWDEVETSRSIAKGLRRIIDRAETIPGFWHPMYPGGDPRCKALFAFWQPQDAARRIADEVANLTGQFPTIDFGLVALRRGLELPRGTAADIFTMARAVGWVAHALEQRLDGRLIRPRSRYIGVRPQAWRAPEKSTIRTIKF